MALLIALTSKHCSCSLTCKPHAPWGGAFEQSVICPFHLSKGEWAKYCLLKSTTLRSNCKLHARRSYSNCAVHARALPITCQSQSSSTPDHMRAPTMLIALLLQWAAPGPALECMLSGGPFAACDMQLLPCQCTLLFASLRLFTCGACGSPMVLLMARPPGHARSGPTGLPSAVDFSTSPAAPHGRATRCRRHRHWAVASRGQAKARSRAWQQQQAARSCSSA